MLISWTVDFLVLIHEWFSSTIISSDKWIGSKVAIIHTLSYQIDIFTTIEPLVSQTPRNGPYFGMRQVFVNKGYFKNFIFTCVTHLDYKKCYQGPFKKYVNQKSKCSNPSLLSYLVIIPARYHIPKSDNVQMSRPLIRILGLKCAYFST